MFTIKRQLMLPAALVAMIATSSISFAQCTSCNSTAGYWPGASGAAAGGGSAQSYLHNLRAEYELVTARNSAWPLPFTCQDREHYYQIFHLQYATGMAVAHTLTSEYFNTESNELNAAGQAKVAWIMQNAPSNSKMIYVYEDQTNATMDQRMHSVKATVDKWYGNMGAYQIAKTQIRPNQIPATYQEQISASYEANLPVPVIPISSAGSITSSVSGN